MVFIPVFFQLLSCVSYWCKLSVFFCQLLLWNICVGYWMISENLFWSTFILFLASLIMLLPFVLTELLRKHMSVIKTLLFFICLWALLETGWISTNVIWSWPVVGNLLGAYPKLIQWYEYTGVVGGTLWIMSINLVLFLIGCQCIKFKRIYVFLGVCLLFIINLPLIISNYLYNKNPVPVGHIKVLFMQPSLNYNQSEKALTNKLIKLIKSRLDSTIDLVVSTETPYVTPVWTNSIDNSYEVATIKSLLKKYPKSTVMWGITINEAAEKTDNANYDSTFKFYYHCYNATSFITNEGIRGYRTKKILVPFSERTPYNLSKYLNQKDLFTINNEKNDLYVSGDLKIFPAICSELLNSFFFLKNSAKSNIITIQASERCFKGSRFAISLYNDMARIRSIENRRYIIKSSNQGIACLITDKGNLIKSLSPYKACTAVAIASLLEKQTFYSKYPLFLSFWLLISIILLLCLQSLKIYLCWK
ncbi:hypothetical protein Solca_2921 [Solitalea canadensis DSM 3403]|uniref:Apolipoprotein N-acyltransferase n=2 Tax=Solitalea canadensis TaxID=995 RepID=H8KWF0_SOLCM|nr:hypothetical protein Solca_2921 [Solitalea canadensis DSM 3403]